MQINTIKFWVVFTIVLMAVGILLELAFLSHYEDVSQLIPFIVSALLVVLVIISEIHPSHLLRKLIGSALLLCASSAFLGIYFHLKANWEFESEMHPGQSAGQTLFDSLSGALPALAPASMLILALLSYIYLLINKTIQ